MHNTPQNLPVTRRDFLRSTGGVSLLAFSGFAPSFLARAAAADTPGPGKDRSILVVIQLAGGNDGLNTVIPYEDDNYYRLRPTLGIKNGFIKISDRHALHPSLKGLHKLFDNGKLSIIQNVGYPNPNRSHFRSTEIWETATDSDETLSTGWIGRYLDNSCEGTPKDEDPLAIHSGSMVPQAFFAKDHHMTFGMPGNTSRLKGPGRGSDEIYEQLLEAEYGDPNADYLRQTMMDTLVTERRVIDKVGRYKTTVQYPGTRLAQSLMHVAALIGSGFSTRVYFVSQGGYDTHAGQLASHTRLLSELSTAMAAFQADLDEKGLSDQVLTMTFSEFGRRPSENGSAGTDHGTAAPLFVMGSKVKGGLLGSAPELNLGSNKDLTYSTDFRGIYAGILDNWFETDSATVLGGKYDPVEFV